MNSFTSGLFVICVLISFITTSLRAEDAGGAEQQTTPAGLSLVASELEQKPAEDEPTVQGRSMPENDDVSGRNTKPLRNIVMGIYKNYKSTYLGNKTLTEYKQTLRETLRNKQKLQQQLNQSLAIEQEDAAEVQLPPGNDDVEEAVVTDVPEDTMELATTTVADHEKDKPRRKRKQTQSAKNLTAAHNEPNDVAQEEQYHVGPALNMSLDLANSIVKVNLDGESLKELVTGRWLNDNSEEGRGKKYEMVTRILPLFILPFLIQSAIVPFLVTKLKLLLMKSMLVGKLAIFLLIISAFRNGNKMMQTYEVAPSYWASEPSRRSEMAAAASNMAYNGYRVEGKPAAWIN